MNTILAFSFGSDACDHDTNPSATLSSIEWLARQDLLELHDVVALRSDEDGTVEAERMHEPVIRGAEPSGMLGALAGLVALHPRIEAAAEVLRGVPDPPPDTPPDNSIDEAHVDQVARQLQPGHSALVVLVSGLKSERARERLLGLNGELVQTSFESGRGATLDCGPGQPHLHVAPGPAAPRAATRDDKLDKTPQGKP